MTYSLNLIGRVNTFLAPLNLCVRAYAEFGTAQTEKVTHPISPISKVELYVIISIQEAKNDDLLSLSNYGVLGIVQKGKTLDRKLLTEFRAFLKTGYQSFNHWWKLGVYDKIGSYGVLVKAGKVTTSSSKVKHLYGIEIVRSHQVMEVVEAIRSLQAHQQKRMAKNVAFAKSLREDLDIYLHPELSDSHQGIFRICMNGGIDGGNEAHLAKVYIEMLLTAIFCCVYFPKRTKFIIEARNTHLAAGKFIVESSEVHQLKLSIKEIHTFLGKHLNFINDEFKVRNEEELHAVAIDYVKQKVIQYDQHSHPVDK
ncbi:MAG: hypothetical protein ACPGJS_21605 [Flammeovirgaceae bacterium]